MIQPHKDWYADGVEFNGQFHEDLWRLDLENNIQIQLFINVIDPDVEEVVHGDKVRLFIEHDVRAPEPNEHQRVKYSGEFFPISKDEAILFLGMNKQEVAARTQPLIDRVIALPSDPRYCKPDKPKPFRPYHNFPMPFGPHKGTILSQIPTGYLEGIIRWDQLYEGTRKKIEAYLYQK